MSVTHFLNKPRGFCSLGSTG